MMLKERAIPTWIFIITCVVLSYFAYQHYHADSSSSSPDRLPTSLHGQLPTGSVPQSREAYEVLGAHLYWKSAFDRIQTSRSSRIDMGSFFSQLPSYFGFPSDFQNQLGNQIQVYFHRTSSSETEMRGVMEFKFLSKKETPLTFKACNQVGVVFQPRSQLQFKNAILSKIGESYQFNWSDAQTSKPIKIVKSNRVWLTLDRLPRFQLDFRGVFAVETFTGSRLFKLSSVCKK